MSRRNERLTALSVLVMVATAATMAAGAQSPDGETVAAQGPGTPGAAIAALAEGMLLGVVPSLLPLLLVHLRAPHRRQRRELGMLSLVWPPVVGSFAGLVIWLTLVQVLTHRLGPGALQSSPTVLTALALPQLFLALAFWLAADRLSAMDRTDAHSAVTALAAPVLALPWIPLTPTVASIASGVGAPVEAVMAAAGFTVPALVAALGAAVLSRSEGERPAWRPPAVLGFLPIFALVWISYLLLDAVPTHVLAFVQLGWLALALTARLALVGRSRARRWSLALLGLVLAAGTIWLAGGGERML